MCLSMKLDHICMVSIRSGHYYSILTFKTLGRKCEKHCVVHTVLCSCADSHCKDMHSHIRRGINQTLCVSNRCSVYGAHHTHTHGNVISLQITSLQHCVCVFSSRFVCVSDVLHFIWAACFLQHLVPVWSHDCRAVHTPARDIIRQCTKTNTKTSDC